MEDEMEMSKEELRRWIRDQVEKIDMLQKYNSLQSLLERRKKHACNLLELSQSVAECEKTVKELYSLLGWEYRESDSDNGEEPTFCGQTQPFQSGSSRCLPTCKKSAPQWSMTKDKDGDRDNGRKQTHTVKREAVVVLDRLSRFQINKLLRQSSTQSKCSEDDSSSCHESDKQWEPSSESSDSDFSISEFSVGSNKRRKVIKENKLKNILPTSRASRTFARKTKDAKTTTALLENSISDSDSETSVAKATTSQSSTKKTTAPQSNTTRTATALSTTTKTTTPQSNIEKTATPQSNTKKTTAPQSNTIKTATPPSNTTKTATPPSNTIKTATPSNTTKTTTPQSNTKTSAKSEAVKTSTSSADNTGKMPVNNQSYKTTETPPSAPPVELSVNMTVLARRRPLSWQLGKITEIITKEDGRIKYKVIFEEKGRCLVSGHHIAFENIPTLSQLFVGARVVIKQQADFLPGVLVEVPSRKNRMRFLVFVDDHTPVYVGLPLLHLVCRPLPEPLLDIPDDNHRNFLKRYLKNWPYPTLTQYRIGNMVNIEHNGVQQKCEVITIDCSLMEVSFKSDEHKEWIFRGSMRLEHLVSLKKDSA